MALTDIIVAGAIVALNLDALPGVFAMIFADAFSPMAGVGAAIGWRVKRGVHYYGVRATPGRRSGRPPFCVNTQVWTSASRGRGAGAPAVRSAHACRYSCSSAAV